MIEIRNLRSSGFANDPTAVDADVDFVHGDVVTLIGVATVSDRGDHPTISFDNESWDRFKAQSEHTADEVLKAMLARIRDCNP